MSEINKKIRILHVDDESDTREVVKIILENEGYDVVSVPNGKEALSEVNLNNFDLLILDIMMPDLSGFELYRRIFKIKSTYKVVFLSILDVSEEKLEELKHIGVRDYIKKPFDNNDFLARIRKVLNS